MKNFSDLISSYVKICEQWGEYIANGGNSRKANVLYKKIRVTENQIKETEDGSLRLLSFLEHPNGYVRLNVAVSLLDSFSPQAEKCLERLAKERENLGFIAEITLSEWKKDALNVQ